MNPFIPYEKPTKPAYIQEYLYIEDFVMPFKDEEEEVDKEVDEGPRGIIIIQL